jgi:phage replication-related protein YjqB (UPF0714/DUF867 family)
MLSDLIASPGVREELVLRGPTGVMALHGGLEAGTAEAARLAAGRAGASLYVVEQPGDFRWHVPSTKYDPRQSRRLRAFLDHVRVAVSIHGFGRRGMQANVLVGGRNERLRSRLGASIARATGSEVLSDPAAIPSALRGTHPRNPVNLPEFGGAQVELSPQARSEREIGVIADAIAVVLAAEQSDICGTG